MDSMPFSSTSTNVNIEKSLTLDGFVTQSMDHMSDGQSLSDSVLPNGFT